MEDPAPALVAPGPADAFGKYVRIRRIGAGGMGEVWKAWDRELGRWVALKLLYSGEPEETARFRREARAAARINHPNVACVYETGELDGRPFIAMQLVDGPTLLRYPRRDTRTLVTLVRDAALAVHEAHRCGVIHRDLKPENILVEDAPGGKPRVVVTDFGLAKQADVGRTATISGLVVGTPSHMSPEQAAGKNRETGPRSDIYSLGATLYDVLTGRPPFRHEEVYALLRMVVEEEPVPPRRLRPGLDPDLEMVILKCLDKDPLRRYGTARELADELTRWLEGEHVLARRPSTLYRIVRFVRKRRTAVTAAAVAVAAFLALGLWAVSSSAARRRAELLAARAEIRRLSEAAGRREAEDRARTPLDSGRRILEQMRVHRRGPGYDPKTIEGLAAAAEREFRRAFAFVPGHPEAHLGIARARTMAGDRAGAIEAMNEAIRSSPTFGAAYLDRARYRIDEFEMLRCGSASAERARLRERLDADLAEADRHANEAVERLYLRGLLAFAAHDHAAAERLLAEYLELAPEDGKAHAWRGHALYHLGRFREAVAEATRALDCDGRDAIALNGRGIARLLLGESEAAFADFSRAIELKPDFAEAYLNRGAARVDAKDLDGALADLDRVLELDPAHPRALYNRGNVKQTRGDLDGALEDHTRAVELEPRYVEAVNNRGVTHSLKSERLEARGRAREARIEMEAALEDFERALRLSPRYAEARLNRGIARHRLGLAGAIEDIEAALALRPGWEAAREWRERLRR